MNYEFHPEARSEFLEAVSYYEECLPGLGERFVRCVEEGIQQICEDPLRWRILREDVRRFLLHVFPFAILYTVEADHVSIVAVMHCSREPGYWQERLKGAQR